MNLDGGWPVDRFDNGTIIADPVRFPSGIPALVNLAHAKGFKFGLYTARTSQDCDQRPGSYEHEAVDGALLCSWRVDYLKNDDCGGTDYPRANTSWIRFKAQFDKCYEEEQHPIFASIEYCQDPDGCGQYIREEANAWRTHQDVQANWDSIMQNLEA